MTGELDVQRPEIPTFSECVVGYRAWVLGDDGQLWPLRGRKRPWAAGVNTARCECGTSDGLHFRWSVVDGKRVLEPAVLHDAPGQDCACGLYSVRRPRDWTKRDGFREGRLVAGAVASWGRMQVHPTGVRAEHACVVALAHPPDVTHEAAVRIARAAERYRVVDVEYGQLEHAALEHGQPLPDVLHENAAAEPTGQPDSHGLIHAPAQRAPDAVGDDPAFDPPGMRTRVRPWHLAAVIGATLLVLVLILVVFDHRSTPCNLQIIHLGAGGTIEQCASGSVSHTVAIP